MFFLGPSSKPENFGRIDPAVNHLFPIASWREGPTSDHKVGVCENSVPLNPMVNDHYPY